MSDKPTPREMPQRAAEIRRRWTNQEGQSRLVAKLGGAGVRGRGRGERIKKPPTDAGPLVVSVTPHP